ncbi:MAG TPA: cyclic nucleotide-binding domain-containing protein [Labilithrix sp.]|nr:cyclic nucleotide-binding domain-containing protein [Labilithrix sp.]
MRLRGVPVFRSMTTTELAPLAATMRSATFEKGDVILREDEPPRSFHMLVRGSVTMRRRGNKIRTIKAPGAVGFLSLLARTSGGTEAVAESRTETFELREGALGEMFEDHFSVLLGTLRWITERLIQENLVQEPPPFSPPADGLDRLIGDRELGTVERIFLLRRTLGFKHANVNSTARLVRSMKEVRLPAGATVWRPGEPATLSLFLVKGKMELSWKNPVDGRRMVQVVGPGYIVGGAEAIASRPRWNHLVTTEPAVFLQGSRERLIDMLEDDFEVALQFLSMLSGFLLAIWDRKAEAEAMASAGKAPRDSSRDAV